jgi:phosphopantothenoylcysteine decarboxylase/phosphopantothenate--cysteine ligase
VTLSSSAGIGVIHVTTSDLHVQLNSDALKDRLIDVIVSGSIGAVESVRFIRSLRRLGAEVQPWLTKGGALFTTATALSWAAARPCRVEFEGTASHISLGEACIIAPASASIISQIAAGSTDTPSSALVASYLGMKKPVFLVANMHDSMHESPFVQEAMQKVMTHCRVLEARREEGKHKFPEPAVLADEIAHRLNNRPDQILVTMGTTRGYIDDVRYISNYSSGALGSRIAEEFYRQGFQTSVVQGPCPIKPRTYSKLIPVETNEQMGKAVLDVEELGIQGAVFSASVLDFVPTQRRAGKLRSSEALQVDFGATPKIISTVTTPLRFKVGFKLESAPASTELAQLYLSKYNLTHLVMNQLQNVSAEAHLADIWRPGQGPVKAVSGKEAIARALVSDAKSLLG